MIDNFQRIIIRFCLWLALGLVICLVGVTGVFADTYYTNYFSDIYYYDNNGSSISAVTTQWNESLQSYISNNITTVANSYGAGVGFNSPIQLIKNHTYTFSISFPERNNIALSSKRNIALGNGPYNSGYNYTQNNYHAETIMASIVKGNIIQYSFTATDNYGYIFMPWTTTSNSTQNYFFNQIIIDDLGSEGVSISDINTSLSNQTTILNNSISNSTNTITQNSNANRDLIINNQNQNTQQQIESQKVCNYIDKFNIETDNKYLISDGSFTNSNYYGITNYIKVNSSTEIKVVDNLNNNAVYYCFYNINKTLLSCSPLSSLSINQILNIPSSTSYFRTTINKKDNKPKFNICENGNQALDDSINDLNNNLTDSSPIDMGSLGNTAGWLPPGPIDSIINLPLNLFNNLVTALNGTCQPLNVPLPYVNTTLTIPCISTIFSQINGLTTFWSWVGAITSVLILYKYLLSLYKYYDDLTTLKANFISDFGGAP